MNQAIKCRYIVNHFVNKWVGAGNRLRIFYDEHCCMLEKLINHKKIAQSEITETKWNNVRVMITHGSD